MSIHGVENSRNREELTVISPEHQKFELQIHPFLQAPLYSLIEFLSRNKECCSEVNFNDFREKKIDKFKMVNYLIWRGHREHNLVGYINTEYKLIIIIIIIIIIKV